MTPPSRSTQAGRVYLDLQKLARLERRPVQELFQFYILESFLDRLSQSTYRERLVLKGGVLLAAFYTGVRVSLGASLLTARIPFHVDVNVGDPITPPPQDVRLQRVRGGEIVVLGYSIGMVHAEKIVTAITRGTTNTRWRDFVDIYALASRHPIDGKGLTVSLQASLRTALTSS